MRLKQLRLYEHEDLISKAAEIRTLDICIICAKLRSAHETLHFPVCGHLTGKELIPDKLSQLLQLFCPDVADPKRKAALSTQNCLNNKFQGEVDRTAASHLISYWFRIFPKAAG